MDHKRTAALAAAFLAAMCGVAPAFAQYAPWGAGPGWGGNRWDGGYPSQIPSRQSRDPRENRVEVSRFVASDQSAADQLGHGPIAVTSHSGEDQWTGAGERAAFEAAIVDALVGAGYDTQHPSDAQAQIATLQISRRVLVPAEEKRKPVSGSAGMSVGTRGSAYGLALNVDMTKPRAALVSTRLDTRITDPTSGKVLWEGYATIATREGDEDWNESRIAGKLAAALFDDFPRKGASAAANAPTG